MNIVKLPALLVVFAIILSSCGSGQPERVKADSSVTSASVGSVQLPDAINTDTTTAAPLPLNDSATAKQADSQAVNFPDAAKEAENNHPKKTAH